MCHVCLRGETPSLCPSLIHSSSRSSSGLRLAHTTHTLPDRPLRLGQPFGSLTGNGFRRDGSFLQAPLTPGTQGFLLLHLRGRVLCRHQRLGSWGQRITPLGVFFLYDRHPDVLGISRMADSTGQGRTQSLGFLRVTMGDPKEQKVVEQRSDRHSGQRGRPSHKTRRERLFQKQPHAGLSANQAISWTFV